METTPVLGIDVGGSYIKCGLVSAAGIIEQPERFDTVALLEATGPAGFLQAPLRHYLDRYPDLKNVGIGLPGYLSADRKTILRLPNIDIPYPLPLADQLHECFPQLDIRMENDANCAALGEYSFGAGAGKDCLLLTMGTGIGSGAIINGRLFRGSRGNGMELGHMIHEGNITVEELIGKAGILSYAAGLVGNKQAEVDPEHSFSDLLSAAAAGDAAAEATFCYTGKIIGQLVYNVLQVLDTTNIYIGGGISAAFEFLHTHIMDYLQPILPEYYKKELSVTRASLGNEAGLLGAALLHRHH